MSHYSDIRDRLQAEAPQGVSMAPTNVWRHPYMEPKTLNIPKNVIALRTTPKSGAVKSDGGSSSYYDFTIHSSYGGSLKVKTGDVIRAMVGNDFDLGNIIKACRRVSENMNGRGKEGTDVSYDLTKIAYFANELKKALGETKEAPKACWEEVNANLEAQAKDGVVTIEGQQYTAKPYTSCNACDLYGKDVCVVAPCNAGMSPTRRSVIFVKEPTNG